MYFYSPTQYKVDRVLPLTETYQIDLGSLSSQLMPN